MLYQQSAIDVLKTLGFSSDNGTEFLNKIRETLQLPLPQAANVNLFTAAQWDVAHLQTLPLSLPTTSAEHLPHSEATSTTGSPRAAA